VSPHPWVILKSQERCVTTFLIKTNIFNVPKCSSNVKEIFIPYKEKLNELNKSKLLEYNMKFWIISIFFFFITLKVNVGIKHTFSNPIKQ